MRTYTVNPLARLAPTRSVRGLEQSNLLRATACSALISPDRSLRKILHTVRQDKSVRPERLPYLHAQFVLERWQEGLALAKHTGKSKRWRKRREWIRRAATGRLLAIRLGGGETV